MLVVVLGQPACMLLSLCVTSLRGTSVSFASIPWAQEIVTVEMDKSLDTNATVGDGTSAAGSVDGANAAGSSTPLAAFIR